MKDYIIKALTKDGTVRAFAAITTDMINKARQIHDTSPVATAALGRTLTAAAMMGSMLKGEQDTLTLQIKGDGPLGGIVAVADSKANVKGYVHQSHVDLPLKPDGKLDVGKAVGKNGYLSIVRDFGLKEPYVGRVPLVSGEIAEDLTFYYARSEQIPSVVALGVLIDVDLSVKAAGGFIVQLMPGADDKTIDILENTLAQIPPVSSMISGGMTAEDMLDKVLNKFEWSRTDTVNTGYNCDCSRERIESALISLGKKELKGIIEEQGKAEVTCHFCNEIYRFNKQELEHLLEAASS
ncbi:MAG: Hsp33 family molecular chaperone HslO [Clostridiaceae bacterium]|nr:Hsp33 family molecular chaperone HslO [Clostridiaceae bacterium]